MTEIHHTHLPYKLIHNFPYSPDAPTDEKKRVVDETLAALKNKGFGGIVTNVSTRRSSRGGYLDDPEEWEILRYIFKKARETDMGTWIYDEDGYPSGSAGGHTLKDHPEWQCRAVALKTYTVNPGETAVFDIPKGHLGIKAVYVYDAPSLSGITDDDVKHPLFACGGSKESVSYVSGADHPVTAAVFLDKYMYEGTHAIHNVFRSQRYIDVGNRDAIAAYIENTYKPYCGKLAGAGQIEAFFTDEPSYMGAYLNLALFPQAVADEFDETMEFLPCVNWSRDLSNRFHARHGYPIEPNMIRLFCGDTDEAKKIRVDFYETLSNLYETSFFSQISDYCASQGVPFSGHLLLEDDIRYHPPFEGNFFSLIRHMQLPGIDLLHGLPEKIRYDAFTPKLISSIARFNGRKRVMSEISAHAQGGNVTPEQFLGTMYTQYALGINAFNSYFSEKQVDEGTYRRFNLAVGRLDAMMSRGDTVTEAAVYYPIETAQAGYIPRGRELYGELADNTEGTVCMDSIRAVQEALLSGHIGFGYLDIEALEKCRAEDGRIVMPSGGSFRVLIIPESMAYGRLDDAVRRLKKAGVRVLRLESGFFKRSDDDLSEDVTAGDLCSEIAKTAALSVCADAPQLIHMTADHMGKRYILLTNTSADDVSVSVSADLPGKARIYDPLTDVWSDEYDSGDIPLTVPPYGAKIIVG